MQPGKGPGEPRGGRPSGWSTLADSPTALRGFLLGNAVGDLGNGFFRLALPWLVYDLTGSAAALGVLAAVAYAPTLLMPWMGRLVDRTAVRSVLFVSLAVQGMSLATLGVLLNLHRLSLPMVDVGAILATGGGLMSWTATQVVVQRLTPAHARVAVNGFTSMLFNLSWYVSPAVAGLVIGHWGVAWALFVNALAMLTVMVPLFWLPALNPVQDRPTSLGAPWRTFTRATSVLVGTLVSGFWNFTWGAVYALQVFFFRHQLHLDAETVGLVGMLAGVGPMVLAVLGPYLVQRLRTIVLLSGTLVLSGLGMLGLALTHNWWEATLAVGAIDGAAAPVGIVVSTLTQRTIPSELYGQVTAWQTLVEGVGVPLAGLLAGAVAVVLGAPATIAAAGVVTLSGGMLLPATGARRVSLGETNPHGGP